MMKRWFLPDSLAVIALIFLWWLFFWRLLTPVLADQVSLLSGDFSGQFVAFGAYQYERFASGEVPLWNPYNNGGFPFIADTQSAVFYPPRLLTIALSSLSGGWTYNALQMEMAAHILLYTLLMYAFVRRLTIGNTTAGVIGSFIAAIIAGYGGFMAGYPPLQLALLEAAVWLPLALLGILEGTQHVVSRRSVTWLTLAGVALGLSWTAGHPQTSLLITYLVVAYLGYRVYIQKSPWWMFIAGTMFVGLITFGITAVQLLPGFEYLARTMRGDFGFDAKAGGFPFQDIIQLVFPGVMSFWSPLFVGVTGLILAGIGLASKARDRLFWCAAGLLALGLSLGGNSVIYHALYNLLPGLRFFRGQERAAYIVAHSLAVLAGLGTVTLLTTDSSSLFRRVRYSVAAVVGICAVVSGVVLVLWIGNRVDYDTALTPVLFSTFVAGGFLLLRTRHDAFQNVSLVGIFIAALVVFELFTVNMDNSNYEPVPASQQPIMRIPPLVAQVKADEAVPFRVDGGIVRGTIGIYGHGNTGSLYGMADIRGISPLFLDGAHAIIQRELPSEITWELFAVRYVFTDAEELVVPSEIIGRDYPNGEVLNLHRLNDPRPFAHLVYDYTVVESDPEARALLADPNFDPRNTALLHRDLSIALPDQPPETAQAIITEFAPEAFTIQLTTPENAILSIAHVDYPGWQAQLDGNSAEIIRAYGGLTALAVPPGEHTVEFRYEPLSYRIGSIFSLLTWAGVIIMGLVILFGAVTRRTRAIV